MHDPLSPERLRAVLDGFSLYGEPTAVEPYGSGHINLTYRSTYDQAGTAVRYIHQRINKRVFLRPDLLMENIGRVIRHLEAGAGSSRRNLRLVPARDGRSYLVDAEGEYWRTYLFVEGTAGLDLVEDTGQAYRIAEAVGDFLSRVATLGGPRLYETIPAFHDAEDRFGRFRAALAADAVGRAGRVGREIDWFLAAEERATVLTRAVKSGAVPERIGHNDTKANNVLLDDAGGGACVIDLDTVMPGSPLYDFGDLARTSTGTAAEDERDGSAMRFDPERFLALAAGFRSGLGPVLTPAEAELLPEAGPAMTTVIGLRFLTDYLAGDRYFRVARPDHNLDRARTQIALADSMLASRAALDAAGRSPA